MHVLLDADFPGNAALREQLSKARVRRIDEDGSLEISVDDAPRAEVVGRVPVEAETEDSDGVPIHVSLHVVNGLMNELELYREDSKPVKRAPAPEALRVLVL